MTSPPRRQRPITSREAAFMIFDNKQYHLYLQWQTRIDSLEQHQHCGEAWEAVRQAVREAGDGGFPTPIAYKTFMNWLRKRGELYPAHPEVETSLVVAKSCRHPIHPGVGPGQVDTEVCPVCLMRQCLDGLKRIWKLWADTGAPGYRYKVEGDQQLYPKVKALWVVEKQRWSNLVAKFEQMAELEEAWEDSGIHEGEYTWEELINAQSCKAALQLAWANNPGNQDGNDVAFVPGTPLTRKPDGNPLGSPANAPSFSSDASEQASSPSLPSSPPLPPELGAADTDEAAPTRPSSEQPESIPSSPPTLPQISPPPSPDLEMLDTSAEESASSSDRRSSSPASYSSSEPASPRGSPVSRKKKQVVFADDVADKEDHQKRSPGNFHRRHRAYDPGAHACPSEEGWYDTSFQNKKSFWWSDPDKEENSEGVWSLYEQLLEAFGVQVEDEDSDGDSDSDFDMDEEDDDSDDASDEATSGLTEPFVDRESDLMSDGELNSANGQHLLQAAMETHGSNVDRTSEPTVALSAAEFEDTEAEDMMQALSRDEQSQLTSSPSPDKEMTDADPKPDRIPEAGNVGIQVLGRRTRSDFESDSSSPDDHGGGKRQRRGDA